MTKLFTFHRLASLQKASAVFFFVMCLSLVVCKLFEDRIDCQADEDDDLKKEEIEARCLIPSNYEKDDTIKQIDVYKNNNDQLSFYLFLLAVGFTFLKLVWNILMPTGMTCIEDLQDILKQSSFSCARAGAYVFLCMLYLVCKFNAFQHLSGGQFGSFALTWFGNVYHGNTTFLYEVNCELKEENLTMPIYVNTTCKLEMNDDFELIYLILWFWLLLLAIVNWLCLLDYILLTLSSALRLSRLSALLEGFDVPRVADLAKDVDVYFRFESCAGEIEALKRLRLMDSVASSPSSTQSAHYSPSMVVVKF